MARSARQLAASRRNIVKAQRASAASRRGKKRSNKSGHHYGTGKTGRRQARRNKYGSRKHGISIAQQTRRTQRSNKWKRRGSTAVSAAATAYTVYHMSTSGQTRSNHARKARDYASRPNSARMVYKMNRMTGRDRKTSARGASTVFKRKYR